MFQLKRYSFAVSATPGASPAGTVLATCLPAGASVGSSVDEITISTIGAREQPRVRASKYACSM
ncbi:hypothetical protein D3C83_143150 [compost metagenome]